MLESYLQVQAADCPWLGQQDCSHWQQLFWALVVLVAVDFVFSVMDAVAQKSMQQSSRRIIRWCATSEQQLFVGVVPKRVRTVQLVQRRLHDTRSVAFLLPCTKLIAMRVFSSRCGA